MKDSLPHAWLQRHKQPRSVTLATILSLALVGSVVTACGGGQKRIEKKVEAAPPEKSAYTVDCEQQLAERRAAEQTKRYLPPELLLHRWPGQKKSDRSPQVLSEEAMVELLTEGKPRTTLLLARGGTGKSKLAWSLRAQTCGKMPIAQVDLNWDIAQKPANSGNPLLAMAASKLGGTDKNPAGYLAKRFAKQRWALLLDSLDEVPLGQREKVVGYVNAALKAYPTLHIMLLSRPPVYTGNYGLSQVDAFAELPQLDCEHTEAALAKLIGDNDERLALKAFATKFGLLRKSKGKADRCYYPHMATYRDLIVVRKLAKNHAEASKSVDIQKLSSSRAQVYEFFLAIQLVRDLQTVGVLPKIAMGTIDKMLAAKNPGSGDRNARFTSADCVTATGKTNDKPTEAFCERLMQSSLFEVTGQHGHFKLRNQSIYDLFMARWMAAQLDPDTDPGCKAVKARAALFESNEIVGFLVGLKAGQKCLVPLAAQLCASGGFADHHFEQFDQGLPFGSNRKSIIDAAQDAAEKASDGPPDMCVDALFDRLYKSAK